MEKNMKHGVIITGSPHQRSLRPRKALTKTAVKAANVKKKPAFKEVPAFLRRGTKVKQELTPNPIKKERGRYRRDRFLFNIFKNFSSLDEGSLSKLNFTLKDNINATNVNKIIRAKNGE